MNEGLTTIISIIIALVFSTLVVLGVGLFLTLVVDLLSLTIRKKKFFDSFDDRLKIELVIGYVILLILVVVLAPRLSSIPGVTLPSSIPTPTPTPVPTLIIDIPQSSLGIVLDAPAVMQKDVSYAIKIELVPKGKPVITSLAIERATATASETTAVGTPDATLRDAFGSGFEAPFGEATLSSKTFDIEPDGPKKQPLDQPKVVWGWSVTPRSAGMQYLTVTIEATWTTTKGGERGPYRVGDRTFSINVKDAFVSQGHFDVGAMLTSLPATLLGAGGLGALLILWIVRIVRRRQGTIEGNTTSTGGQAPMKQNVRRGRRKGGRRRP